VVEYGDGKLFASPPVAAQKAKVAGEAGAHSEEEIVEDAPLSPEEEHAVASDEVVAPDFAEVIGSPPEPEPQIAAEEPSAAAPESSAAEPEPPAAAN